VYVHLKKRFYCITARVGEIGERRNGITDGLDRRADASSILYDAFWCGEKLFCNSNRDNCEVIFKLHTMRAGSHFCPCGQQKMIIYTGSFLPQANIRAAKIPVLVAM
jgi:hypothetical protein